MIFLSYSQNDKAIVAPIAESFSKVFGKEKVFFDQWSIQPGDSIIGRMDEGLTACQFFFFFISKNSLSSQMVALEWQSALVKSLKKEVKFIPVKMDDCLIPNILIQNLYINLYGCGLDNAVRQMIDVASGKNTYQSDSTKGFQNIRAHVTGSIQQMKIEFRAQAYMEPHSNYLIVFENAENELSCNAIHTGPWLMGFHKDVVLSDGKKANAFSVSRSEPTSPKFPFCVELSAQAKNQIKLSGLMIAESHDTYRSIPFDSNLSG